MIRILLLSVFLLSLVAEDSLELYIFGLSYHTNRNVDWNEVNPGLAVGYVRRQEDNVDLTINVGTYRDSYQNDATFALFGPRFIMGQRDDWHSTVSITAGLFHGSGFQGLGIVPVMSIGYDWLDVCVTGEPPGQRESDSDPKTATSAMVAVFLKTRVLTF